MSKIRLERCICGQTPTFTAVQVAEDSVVSQFVCQRGQRIPGGGFALGGCGRQGPEVEDAFSDEGTAAASWNAEVRRERKAIS